MYKNDNKNLDIDLLKESKTFLERGRENIKKNSSEGIINYKIAIKLGEVEAMYELADYYRTLGKYKKMEKYLILACDKNHTDSEILLCDYYEFINDNKKKVDLLCKLEKKENPIAIFNLGIHYYYQNNISKMKECYLKAFDLGESDAMINLGEYYLLFENNLDKVRECYEKALEKDNPNALYCLGEYYYHIGNIQKMLYYMEKGDSEAMNYLGEYYESLRDYSKMIMYYERGVKEGNIICMKNLANYYKKIGNKEKMIIYYKKASKYGDEESTNYLKSINITNEDLKFEKFFKKKSLKFIKKI